MQPQQCDPSSLRTIATAESEPQKPSDFDAFTRIIGASSDLCKAVEVARRLAKVDAPVLIHGETGVGKDLFARAIHEAGPRARAPFVALNCGGLPRDLLASELFGYTEGAFTGARRGGMTGKLEAAHGGTLFLDEISEMPVDLQPFLLRALEGHEICRLGENRSRKVDFRLVAACNRDLRLEASDGRFRSDLYYRISVTTLRVPPLRDRIGDLPTVVEHFASNVANRHGRSAKRFAPETLAALCHYGWPGNLRELRNVVEATALLTDGDVVTPKDLPSAIRASPAPCLSPSVCAESGLSKLERDAIAAALEADRGNLTSAARELGIARSTLYAKVKRYALEPLVDHVRVDSERSRASDR
ncbi:MAG TPA: sigma 54-interacting transcriptional regulator [Polyangiaceae bacterium]|nr:sigma 54-interacting transcriptional regulator [Polyangiaceae bacterium]